MPVPIQVPVETVNTRDPAAVKQVIIDLFHSCYNGADWSLMSRVFSCVEMLFTGGHPRFQAIDVSYHDFEHTLQATLCMARLLASRHLHGAEPRLTDRQFNLGIAAGLLHDTGYLKERGDREGTGAKYTAVHVHRSATFAGRYLLGLGCSPTEACMVQHAIFCTGAQNRFAEVPFESPQSHMLAAALVTGDYLGQMAAHDYLDELDILFHEFEESDRFNKVPDEKRLFRNSGDLIRKTPLFWRKIVRPKLDGECMGLHRFLADPYPDGPNPYILRVEHNIALLEERTASCTAATVGA